MATQTYTMAQAVTLGVTFSSAFEGVTDQFGHSYRRAGGPAEIGGTFNGTAIYLGGYRGGDGTYTVSIDGGAFAPIAEGSYSNAWGNDAYLIASGLTDAQHTFVLRVTNSPTNALFMTGITGGDVFASVTGATPALVNTAGPTPATLATATGYPTVSGNIVSIVGPTLAGATGTVHYQWRVHESFATGTGTLISGGAGGTVKDLVYTVPVGLRGKHLGFTCDIYDDVTAFAAVGTAVISYYPASAIADINSSGKFGSNGWYAQAWVPEPAPLTPSLSAAVAATITLPAGKQMALILLGDSLTAQHFTDAPYETALGAKRATTTVVGYSGTTWADWQKGAGTGVYEAALAAIETQAALGHILVIDVCLGTNSPENPGAFFDNLASDMATAGIPTTAYLFILHGVWFTFSRPNYYIAAMDALDTVYAAEVAESHTYRLLMGQTGAVAHIVNHSDQTDLTFHPSGGGGARMASTRVYAGVSAIAGLYPSSVPDTTPPTLSALTIPTAGNILTGTLSKSGCLPASGTGGFTLTGTAGSRTVTSWTISATTLTLMLSGVVYSPVTDTPLLTYNRAATTNDIADAAGNFLANFTAASVTNGSTQTVPVDPDPGTGTSSADTLRLLTVQAPDGGTQYYEDGTGDLIRTRTYLGNVYATRDFADGSGFSATYTPAEGD